MSACWKSMAARAAYIFAKDDGRRRQNRNRAVAGSTANEQTHLISLSPGRQSADLGIAAHIAGTACRRRGVQRLDGCAAAMHIRATRSGDVRLQDAGSGRQAIRSE